MVFERAFLDVTGQRTAEAEIDVVAMGGIAFARAFELCAKLDRAVIALQDNDGNTVDEVREGCKPFFSADRQMCVGDKAFGHTLEPQILAVNGAGTMRKILRLRAQDNPETWMPNHKTETALRILESSQTLKFPAYILEAVGLAR